MKKSIIALLALGFISSMATPAFSEVDTKGKFSIGGQHLMKGGSGLAAAISSGSSSSAAASLASSLLSGSSQTSMFTGSMTLNDGLRVKGLLGFSNTSANSTNLFSVSLGAEANFYFAQFDNGRAYLGIGAAFIDVVLGQSAPTNFAVTPMFGVEYFLSKNLSVEGALGLPITLSSFKQGDNENNSFNLSTTFSPLMSMNYYF